MKRITFFAVFVFISFCEIASAQSLVQSFLFDFGANDVTNGDITPSPDGNGNYWNNVYVTAGSTSISSTTFPAITLTNTSGISTTLGFGFVSGSFTVNGKQTANGGLLSPVASNFGTNAELAIATATEDYIFTGSTTGGPVFKITGLDPTKTYVFKLFASRSGTTTRTSQYTFQGAGAAVVGTLNSSTAGTGTNLGNVYVSSGIAPNENGEISITTISLVSGSSAYLNCMKIEEYSITTNTVEKKNDNIEVYPTASTSSVFVTGAKESVELYNLSGSKVLESKKSQSNKIDITSLSNGVYMLIVDGYKCFKITKI